MAKKPAEKKPQDGGAKRLLALGGVALIVIMIAGAYLVLKQLATPAAPQPPGGVGPSANYTPVQQATPAEYSISPLVAEFGIDSSPVLLFNCNYERVGTFATKEKNGQVSEGTERQDLINALCRASGKESICAYQSTTATSGSLMPLSSPACAGGSKVRVYAFYGPSCGNSANQRPILEGVAALFSDDVNVTFVCTPIFEGDYELCRSLVTSGKYDE